MKTAREKVECLVDSMFEEFAGKVFTVSRSSAICKAERLLKEQGMDIRHACAEAVINLNGPLKTSMSDGGEWIEKDLAYAAIMNTKAV